MVSDIMTHYFRGLIIIRGRLELGIGANLGIETNGDFNPNCDDVPKNCNSDQKDCTYDFNFGIGLDTHFGTAGIGGSSSTSSSRVGIIVDGDGILAEMYKYV